MFRSYLTYTDPSCNGNVVVSEYDATQGCIFDPVTGLYISYTCGPNDYQISVSCTDAACSQNCQWTAETGCGTFGGVWQNLGCVSSIPAQPANSLYITGYNQAQCSGGVSYVQYIMLGDIDTCFGSMSAGYSKVTSCSASPSPAVTYLQCSNPTCSVCNYTDQFSSSNSLLRCICSCFWLIYDPHLFLQPAAHRV